MGLIGKTINLKLQRRRPDGSMISMDIEGHALCLAGTDVELKSLLLDVEMATNEHGDLRAWVSV